MRSLQYLSWLPTSFFIATTTMAGRKILTLVVVLVAVLGGIYQLRYKEFVSVMGLGRTVENIGSRDCETIPELQACESKYF